MGLSPIHTVCSSLHTYQVFLVCSLSPALWYRLLTADVHLTGFPNCPRATSTSILDSQCTHWNSSGTPSSCHWLCHPVICSLSAVLSCNVKAEVEVDFATDGQPAISSWCRALLSTILTINYFFM
jgi:hypothetical protein